MLNNILGKKGVINTCRTFPTAPPKINTIFILHNSKGTQLIKYLSPRSFRRGSKEIIVTLYIFKVSFSDSININMLFVINMQKSVFYGRY